jgi:hypothetical protein
MGNIARALAEGDVWDEVLRKCQMGLRIDPTNLKAHLFLVMYHAKHGEPKQAHVELDTIPALKPPNEEMLRRSFASLGRRWREEFHHCKPASAGRFGGLVRSRSSC